MLITAIKTAAIVAGAVIIVTGTTRANAESSAATNRPPAQALSSTKQAITPSILTPLLREAVGIEDPAMREKQLRAIMSRLELADLQWARESMAQIPFGQKKTKTFNKPDGKIWFEYTTGGRPDAMKALMFRWGQLDPAAALAKSTQLGNDIKAPDAMIAAYQGWIDINPVAAIEQIRKDPDLTSKTHRDMLQVALRDWVAKDPQAAANLFPSLTREQQVQHAAGDIAGGWATSDPIAASRWASKLADPEIRAAAYVSLASTWAMKDQAAATAWAQALPAGPDREAAERGLQLAAEALHLQRQSNR